jgi:hypothetical protein
MNILKDIADGIYPLQPFQQAVYDKLAGGLTPGQLTLYGAGRQTGKSYLSWHFLKTRYYDTNLCKEIVLPMKPKSKYQFSRAKWYEAEFGPADYLKVREVREWCVEQFGPEPRHHDAWSRWYHKNHNRIFFRDAKDYEWFLLRWTK